MASALLASRNEPCWGSPKVYMRKNPNPNPNKFFPNPNPSFDHHASDLNRDKFRPMELDEPSASAAAAAASDDSSSFNRKTTAADLGQRSDFGARVSFNVASYSKKDLRELKRRLMSELGQVRRLASQIESRDFHPSVRSVGYSTSAAYGGGLEVTSSTALPAIHGSDALVPRSMAKTNPLYRAKAMERPITPASALELKKLHTAMMKKCNQILTKLMKHKAAIWFNTPVDVVGMGLHDYHQIIKNPMDLGTAKSNLSKGFYHSPIDFASDIRLTFKNALVYNPEGHDVHKLADQLLKHFESIFGPAISKYEKQRNAIVGEEEDRRQMVSSWGRAVPVPASKADPGPTISMPPQIQTPVRSKPVQSQLVRPQPVVQQQLQLQQEQTMRVAMARQPPNPKLSDPNKRLMSMEEKHKLSSCIQNLPGEKMAEVLEIVSRRNETLQNGDEVEIDFEVMDNETLWELDLFVNKWYNKMSKMKKRQESMSNGDNHQDPWSADPSPPVSIPCNKSPVLESLAAMKSKKGDTVDEEVDIGDEMLTIHYPSVEIVKESSCSSSGSDTCSSSSSSSSSDSESSGSDSDDDGSMNQSPRGLLVGQKGE